MKYFPLYLTGVKLVRGLNEGALAAYLDLSFVHMMVSGFKWGGGGIIFSISTPKGYRKKWGKKKIQNKLRLAQPKKGEGGIATPPPSQPLPVTPNVY